MSQPVLSYNERAALCRSPFAKQLLQLLDEKKTNLCLSIDVTTSKELLEFVNELGSEICVLKTHIDIIKDYTPQLHLQLSHLASKHHFFLFEDRKFADIGNTVNLQYAGGIFRIADWAHIVNAHTIVGPGVILGLAEALSEKENRGFLLIAELSSGGHLMDENYMQATLKLAQQYPEYVIGFITQHALTKEPSWINFTPGIKLQQGGDKLGQQYVSPEKAIMENGADIIIVGRGILDANDPLAEARKYREIGYQCYLKRVGR